MPSQAQIQPGQFDEDAFSDGEPESPMSVLVVGDVAAWTAGGQALPRAERIRFAEFADITPALLSEVDPDVVLSSVFTESFDAFDLATVLSTSGYSGRYRALTPALPDPDLIRREVRGSAPGVDFDLLVIDGRPNLR